MKRSSLYAVTILPLFLSQAAHAQSITQGLWGHIVVPGGLATDVTVRLFTSPPAATDLPDVSVPVMDTQGAWEASVAPGTWYVQFCHDLQGALNCRDDATPILTHRDGVTGEPAPIVVYANQVAGPIGLAFDPCLVDSDCPAGSTCLRNACAAGGGPPLCSIRPQPEGSSCGSFLLCTMYGACVASMPVVGDVTVTADILDSQEATWQADFTVTGGSADWSLSWGDGADEFDHAPSPVSATHRYDRLGPFYLNGNVCGTVVEAPEGEICAPIPTRRVVVRDDDANPPTIEITGSSGTESTSASHSFARAVSDASGLTSVNAMFGRGTTVTQTSASSSGNISFAGVPPGRYWINVVACDSDADRPDDGACTTGRRDVLVLGPVGDVDGDLLPDGGDRIVGDRDFVSSNTMDLEVMVDGIPPGSGSFSGVRAISIVANGLVVAKFDWDFTASILDLGSLTVDAQTAGTPSARVEGLTAAPASGLTLLLHADSEDDEISTLCCTTGPSAGQPITHDCSAGGEVIVMCPNQKGDITCSHDPSAPGDIAMGTGWPMSGCAALLDGRAVLQEGGAAQVEIEEAAITMADFNGDGQQDTVVGLPWARNDLAHGGGVVAIYDGAWWWGEEDRVPTLTSQSRRVGCMDLIGAPESFDHLGWALAAGDFDGDGGPDLAIGTPYENIETVQPTAKNAGAVYVLYAPLVGFVMSGGILGAPLGQALTQDGLSGFPERDDLFGYALATGDFNGDGFDDLAVGSPGDGAGALPLGSGMVHVLYGSAAGLDESDPQTPIFYAGNSNPSFGLGNVAPEAWGWAGSVLASADFNGDGFDDLAVSIPNSDNPTGPAVDAGAVAVLFGNLWGLDAETVGAPDAQVLTQSPYAAGHVDLPGVAETGDHVGATLAAGHFRVPLFADLAIGVPSEDIGTVMNAGAVLVAQGTNSGLFGVQGFSQTEANAEEDLRGDAAAGTWLGSSLATGNFDGVGMDDLAIGAPGAVVAGAPAAGQVHVVYGVIGVGLDASVDEQILAQYADVSQEDLAGVPEPGDVLGGWLGAGDVDGNGRADLVIAATGENQSEGLMGFHNLVLGLPDGLNASSEATDQTFAYGRRFSPPTFGYAAEPSLGARPQIVAAVDFSDLTWLDGSGDDVLRDFGGWLCGPDNPNPNVPDFMDEMSNGHYGVYCEGEPSKKTLPITYAARNIPGFSNLGNVVLQELDPDIDYSQYDNDQNGIVDMNELLLSVVFAMMRADRCNGKVLQTNYLSNDGGGVYVRANFARYPESCPASIVFHESTHQAVRPRTLPMNDDLYHYAAANLDHHDILSCNHGSELVHTNAWVKLRKGWVRPTVVEGNGCQTIRSDDLYVLHDPSHKPGDADEEEFFLVQNRRQSGYDADLPESGAFIQHMDDTRYDMTVGGSRFDVVPPALRLLCAGNVASELPKCRDGGPSECATCPDCQGTPFDGSVPERSYSLTDISGPANTRWNDGTWSGIEVRSFSGSAPTMRSSFVLPW